MSRVRQQRKLGAPLSFKDMSNPFQRFRSQTDMGQVELAAALGVKQSTVSMYESGIRRPRVSVAEAFVKLAKARRIRMSLDEIFSTTKGV